MSPKIIKIGERIGLLLAAVNSDDQLDGLSITSDRDLKITLKNKPPILTTLEIYDQLSDLGLCALLSQPLVDPSSSECYLDTDD